MTTIEKLDYKILIDASGLEKGALKSRKQMRAIERENWKAMSSYQKIQMQMDELQEVFDNGGLSVAVYEKNMAALTAKLDDAGQGFTKTGKLAKKFGVNISDIGAKISAIGVGGTVAGIMAVDRHLTGVIQRQAESIKMFERFGLDASRSLKTYKEAARLAGVDVERLVDANKDLTIRINEAVMDGGVGEMSDKFRELGLDINELAAMDPAEQFRAVGKALQLMVNAGDSAKAMTIVDILTGDAGTESLKGWLHIARTFPQAIDNSAANLKSAAKSIREAQAEYEEFQIELGKAYAPAKEAMSRTGTQILKGQYSFDDFRLQMGSMPAWMSPLGWLMGREGKTGELSSAMGMKTVGMTTQAQRDSATAETLARVHKLNQKKSDDARYMGAINRNQAAGEKQLAKMKAKLKAEADAKEKKKVTKKEKVIITQSHRTRAQSLHEWLGADQQKKYNTRGTMRGPGESIAAGSSAAFNITHQRSVRVQDKAQKTRQEQLAELQKNTRAVEQLAKDIASGNMAAAEFAKGQGWGP